MSPDMERVFEEAQRPYPTAEAYEKVCAQVERARQAVEPFRNESGTWVEWVECLATTLAEREAEWNKKEFRLGEEIVNLQAALTQATEAAHAERDMHWKRKVESLETEIERLKAFEHRFHKMGDDLDNARAALATARKEALEEASDWLLDQDDDGQFDWLAEKIRALAPSAGRET